MASLLLYIPLFYVLHLLTTQILRRIQNLPPTPILSLPFLGHLHLLKKPLHRTLRRLSTKHGPIFSLHLGSRHAVVVSSTAAAEECLAKNDVVFANRPNLAVGRIMGYNYTSLTWSSYGDHWRNLRRISSLELLSSQRLIALAGVRRREAMSLLRRLSKTRDHNLRECFSDLTHNVMMGMIAGKRYYGDRAAEVEEAKRFREIQSETLRAASLSNLGDYLSFLRWFGGCRWLEKKMEDVQRKREEFMHGLIQEHKRNGAEYYCRFGSNSKTMIGVLLSLQQSEPEYYTDHIIGGLMLVLLLAGTETTVTTLEWALALLLNNPQALEKAQSEINRHVGNDRLLDESDLPQLHYLHSILIETLRLYPPVPLLIPHHSSEDCLVGGVRVPRGSMLLVNVWAIQNDPSVWVDPESFKPERFIGPDGPKDGFKWLPFGSGRRGCPGEGLAMRMIGLVLGLIIQCFEWDRPNKELVDMSEGDGITMPRAEPLRAKCQPRHNIMKLLTDQIE